MKCYKCNGTGYYDIDNECPVCDGTGEYEPFDADVKLDKLYPTEQNNEEWFCSLSTEEKAKFLFEHGVIVCCFCKRDCVEIDYKTKVCKYDVEPSYEYTGIVKWLKEKHESEKK